MRVRMFETEWHGVRLAEIARSAEAATGPTFYKELYALMLTRGQSLPPEWLDQKHRISRWIEKEYLEPFRPLGIRPRVLSVGAGFGVIETPLLERGYSVELQECQEESLAGVRERFPDVPTYVGDARNIDAPPAAYDLIYMVAVDYVFDAAGYVKVLRELARLLKDQGTVVCMSVTNLSFARIAKEILRPIYEAVRGSPERAPWGWKRTLGEHLAAAKHAGLVPRRVTTFDDDVRSWTRRPIRRGLQLPVSGHTIAVDMTKPRLDGRQP